MEHDYEDPKQALIDLIFRKCTLVYGRDFLDRWQGMELADVKDDWRGELGGMLGNPEAIRHALNHLPAKAPNAVEFRAMCIGAPSDGAPRLPAPEPGARTPGLRRFAEVASRVQANHGATLNDNRDDPRSWGRALRRREHMGERLTMAQRDMWRSALAAERDAERREREGGAA